MLSAALACATTSAASHWIIFFLNGRSALRDIALGGCRSVSTLADSLLFQHRPSFESGSALGASFPARMLGEHLLCKELKPKQPKTETPGLKAKTCALSVTRGRPAPMGHWKGSSPSRTVEHKCIGSSDADVASVNALQEVQRDQMMPDLPKKGRKITNARAMPNQSHGLQCGAA
jgi:hypothetical protein